MHSSSLSCSKRKGGVSMQEGKITLFKEATAIDSLRNNDFDSVSAYGEVVDNSIESGAQNIKIKFKTEIGKRGFSSIRCLAFGDDGSGMDSETLNRCLQLGWSSRYNNRGGIGRFGVGMTLAAIHECKRVEIYSKTVDEDWLYTYIDLDEIRSGKRDDIPNPSKRKPPSDLQDLVNINTTGTLVIWSKYDRQLENGSKLRDDALIWMGRTYRYFIWGGISISIDGEEVKAIDPLYLKTEKTKFPGDPKGESFKDIVFKWPVDEFDAPPNSPAESDITIKTSILPEELRPIKQSGGWGSNRERHIDKNEGISILRRNREVFYGHIPNWNIGEAGWPQFMDIDRWWGCEIHFDPILDRAFTVKNIKRGAVPSKELKKFIKSQILPTRETCLKRVRELWAKTDQENRIKAAEEKGLDRPGDHGRAEDIAKKTPVEQNAIDKGKNFEKEIEDFMKEKGKIYDAEQRRALKNLFESQPFTILENSWRGQQFFDAKHLGGSAVLEYNMGHIFFEKLYETIKSLENDVSDPYKIAKDLRDMVDLLIIAYAKGEARFARDAEMTAEDFIEHLRVNWGQFLQSYVKTWLKEKGG